MTPRSLRSVVFTLLDLSDVPRLFLDSAPRILLYHGVTDERGSGIFNYRAKFIPSRAFGEQIEWLRHTFTILPLETLIERLAVGTLPPRTLAITFDDGYANNYEVAYPILKAAGVPATFFVTTDFVGQRMALPVDVIEYAAGTTSETVLSIPGFDSSLPLSTRAERIRSDLRLRSHMKELPASEAAALIETLIRISGRDLRRDFASTPYRAMTWEQIQEMEQNGMTFAPHTRTHPILSRLPRQAARKEIVESKSTLVAHVAHPLPVFAYPNGRRGDYNAETISILKDADFVASFTTRSGTLKKEDPVLELPRFTMDGATDIHRARLIVGGLYDRLAALV